MQSIRVVHAWSVGAGAVARPSVRPSTADGRTTTKNKKPAMPSLLPKDAASNMTATYKNDGIGLEGTDAEFEELLGQAASLTSEEAITELVDCARYGESDAIRAICDKHGETTTNNADAATAPFVDSKNPSGNTALHMACANGHTHACRLLLSRGADHLANSSGNTPLHWAAANGHEEIVKLLLDEPRFKDKIDVLQKNNFGRSALTEGFSSSNTKLVGHLLEHDSAEEDRLIGGMKKEDVTNSDEADAALNEDGSVKSSETGSSASVQVIHEFDFLREETKMADGAQEEIEGMAALQGDQRGRESRGCAVCSGGMFVPTTSVVRHDIKLAESPCFLAQRGIYGNDERGYVTIGINLALVDLDCAC